MLPYLFIGEQLVAWWLSFFKTTTTKSASCSEVLAGSCCFESCHIFYGAKLCRRSWETKMKENWCTIWIGGSERKVMGGHKTQHLLRVKGAQSPLTFGTWTLEPFQMPGGSIRLSTGFIGSGMMWSWVSGAISGEWSVEENELRWKGFDSERRSEMMWQIPQKWETKVSYDTFHMITGMNVTTCTCLW